MGDFQVHHVKLFNYIPSAIQSLAFKESDKLLAVGREDGSVEIWKTGEERKWLQLKVIPASEKRKINGLLWVKGRLFSAGLHGDITEYDLQRLETKKSVYYGNAFWCIAANHAQTHIAAGCEDGYIRLYEVSNEGVTFDRALQMQQGRVVSLAWHISDEIIVTGSLDNIRIWNVNSGHATQRITTQRTQRNTEVVVWQVAVLKDMTIVSGDSAGRTQFWNGKHGTLLKSYTSHRGPILALCVTQDQTCIFTAGTDPLVASFSLVLRAPGSEAQHWVRGRTFRDHTHDVRALVTVGDSLVSGGVDTQLAVNPTCHDTTKEKLRQAIGKLKHRVPAFPHKPRVTLATEARLLLFQYSHSLELWKLGNTQASSDEDGKSLPLSEQPVKLLEIKTKGAEQIVCSSLSSCGAWLAYSDVDKLRCCHITHNPLSINRVPTIPSSLQPAHHLVFTPDSSRLVSATKTGAIQVLTIEGPDGVDCSQPLVQTFPASPDLVGPFSSLAVSGDGQKVATVGENGKVVVTSLVDSEQEPVILPRSKVLPCCLAFHPTKNQLTVAHMDRNISEYDFKKHEYTAWSQRCHKQGGVHRAWLDKPHIIQQLTFDPSNHDRLLVHDGAYLTIIDTSKPLPSGNDRIFAPRQGKRGHDGTSQSESRTHGVAVCAKYKTIMFIGALTGPNQLVMVERPHQAIFEQLPPTLQQKKFGT